MAELKVVIKDSTNQIFRKKAMERIGYGKGALSTAAEEALRAWASKPERTKPLRRSRNRIRLELPYRVDPELVEKIIEETELSPV
jgi:hypothetical protein